MLGAICGDFIGRPYEMNFVLTKDFPLFRDDSRLSDDTVMTAAVTHAVMNGGEFEKAIVEFGVRHIEGGYGKMFKAWLLDSNRQQGTSWGNGSAMRVSGIAWLADSYEEALELARLSALPSHNHPEGIKGAVAAVAAVRLALEGKPQEEIRRLVSDLTGYDLYRTVDQIRANYPRFKVSCQESVPEAIICALEATSFEDAIRNAVSLGNDADTQAAIAGSIAEVIFGIPAHILDRVRPSMPSDIDAVLKQFAGKIDGKWPRHVTEYLKPVVQDW
jgi:ADP-ribosylglycohydrolase